MEDGIYTLSNNLITDHIRDAIPNTEAAKTVNRLYDGTWHVQTYGEGSPILELNVWGDLTAIKRLNLAQAGGELLKIVAVGEAWTGAIEDKISWRESAPGYYQGSFTLLIIEPEE